MRDTFRTKFHAYASMLTGLSYGSGSGNDLELINKSLNFSASGIFMNEKKFEYTVVLDVKKVY